MFVVLVRIDSSSIEAEGEHKPRCRTRSRRGFSGGRPCRVHRRLCGKCRSIYRGISRGRLREGRICRGFRSGRRIGCRRNGSRRQSGSRSGRQSRRTSVNHDGSRIWRQSGMWNWSRGYLGSDRRILRVEHKPLGRRDRWSLSGNHRAGQKHSVELEDVPVGLYVIVSRDQRQLESRSRVAGTLLELIVREDEGVFDLRGIWIANGLRILLLGQRVVDLVALQVIIRPDPPRENVQFQQVRELGNAQRIKIDFFECGIGGSKQGASCSGVLEERQEIRHFECSAQSFENVVRAYLLGNS
mmetsp:Transcript_12925/g.36410  ORF Transcript_12925/g.36410 Transcript_12925/m.36410 type:complete len:299 (-) Transcript_12925:1226-2122(-)